MNTQVFFIGALACYTISQISTSPVRDNGRNQLESYKETGNLHILMISPDGTQSILKPKDVLSLKSELEKNAGKMILYKLVDGKENSYLLTDHQLQRLVDFEVIAIVSRNESDILKNPGFGHRMVILEKDGTLKSFIYNLTLMEAVHQLPQNYPYNFSTSKNAYHTAFQNSNPSKIDFHL
uniref:Teratocyte cysteine protease n=1 Tax=Cotesia flavipes TaxID=89805 RepID=A0A8K1YTR8_COTFL|nr:teratocyte cysteine protease [Cotesia flavipes]